MQSRMARWDVITCRKFKLYVSHDKTQQDKHGAKAQATAKQARQDVELAGLEEQESGNKCCSQWERCAWSHMSISQFLRYHHIRNVPTHLVGKKICHLVGSIKDYHGWNTHCGKNRCVKLCVCVFSLAKLGSGHLFKGGLCFLSILRYLFVHLTDAWPDILLDSIVTRLGCEGALFEKQELESGATDWCIKYSACM